MKAGRKRQLLTEKELPIMQLLWTNGPLYVRELVALYPEPKPHFNTLATLVRILEDKGHVGHDVVNTSHRFYAITPKEDFQRNPWLPSSPTSSTAPTRARFQHSPKRKKSLWTSCVK